MKRLAAVAALAACAVHLAAACDTADPASPTAPITPPPPPGTPPPPPGTGADAGDASTPCPPAPNFDGGPSITVPAGVRCERYPYPLSGPRNVLEAKDGTIYVAETAAHRIARLGDGGFATVSDAFQWPVGMVETDDGAILVADEHAFAIVRLDPADGGVTPVATALDYVTHIAWGPDKAVYASSFASFDAIGHVKRVDPVDGGRSVFAEDVFDPEGLAFEDGGALLVGELRNPDAGGPGRVLRYPAGGGPRAGATIAGQGFDFVFGVATLPRGGFASAEQIYAGDGVSDRVRVYAPGKAPFDLAAGILRPTGITTTKSGDVLVVESVTVNSGTGWLVRFSGL